eukprot:358883-Lingulodinium_polyedra.AAC.1
MPTIQFERTLPLADKSRFACHTMNSGYQERFGRREVFRDPLAAASATAGRCAPPAGSKPLLLSGYTSEDSANLEKSVRVVTLHKDAESYPARLGKVGGFSYDLAETMYCIAAK